MLASIDDQYAYILWTEFSNLITPKLSLRLSLPSSKDVRKTDRTIGYDNVYDLDRLGITEANEGGVYIPIKWNGASVRGTRLNFSSLDWPIGKTTIAYNITDII